MSAGCPLAWLMAPSIQCRMVCVVTVSRLDRHVAVIHVLRLTGCSWFVQGGKTEMLRLLLNHVAGTHEAAAVGLKNPDTGLQSGLRL